MENTEWHTALNLLKHRNLSIHRNLFIGLHGELGWTLKEAYSTLSSIKAYSSSSVWKITFKHVTSSWRQNDCKINRVLHRLYLADFQADDFLLSSQDNILT
jgi:hypothetical protein